MKNKITQIGSYLDTFSEKFIDEDDEEERPDEPLPIAA